jgi:hypothetical protein
MVRGTRHHGAFVTLVVGVAMRDVGVVYLYRFLEGESPVRRFLKTYRSHRAGMDHDFYVVFKGFPGRNSRASGRALFDNVPISSIEHDDVGYDIGSYLHAAKVVPNPRLILLNTFSQILADNWLAHFDHALSGPGVGVVGATGSWLANTGVHEAGVKCLMRKMSGKSNDNLPRPKQIGMRRVQLYLRAPFDYVLKLHQYGRYPNPHIRTNAFMMERNRFLSLNFSGFTTKGDVHRFESGRHSMTKQILKQNLSPVVVDRNGKIYGISEWKSSSTFWINEQANLIIADNRTSDYAQADRGLQQRLENLAWVRPWNWTSTRADPTGVV